MSEKVEDTIAGAIVVIILMCILSYPLFALYKSVTTEARTLYCYVQDDRPWIWSPEQLKLYAATPWPFNDRKVTSVDSVLEAKEVALQMNCELR